MSLEIISDDEDIIDGAAPRADETTSAGATKAAEDGVTDFDTSSAAAPRDVITAPADAPSSEAAPAENVYAARARDRAAADAEARAEIRKVIEKTAGKMRSAMDRLRSGRGPQSSESDAGSDADANADSDDADSDDGGDSAAAAGGDCDANEEGTAASARKSVRGARRTVKSLASESEDYPPFAQYVTPSEADAALCAAGEPLWTAVTPDNHVIKRLVTPAPAGAPSVAALTRVYFTLTARYYPPYTAADVSAPPPLLEAASTVYVNSTPDEVDCMLGHAQAARGLEIALATLRVGDTALVRCSPTFGYTATRRPDDVPPSAPLEFLLTVTRCEKEPNAHELTADGRLAWAETRRPLGQQLVKEGRLQSALKQYQRALTVLEHADVQKQRPVEHRRLTSLFLTNQAVVNARLGDHRVVAGLCSDVIDGLRLTAHAKARHLRGVALAALGRFEEAEADLKIAVSVLTGAVEKRQKEEGKAQAQSASAAASASAVNEDDDADKSPSSSSGNSSSSGGVDGVTGDPVVMLAAAEAALKRARAQAAASDRTLLARVTAKRGTGAGLTPAGAPALDLYADKPDVAPVTVDPFKGRPVTDLQARNRCEGLWNVVRIVAVLAWARLMQWLGSLRGGAATTKGGKAARAQAEAARTLAQQRAFTKALARAKED
jgi:tetratricopeptide (TPR) repeat protein